MTFRETTNEPAGQDRHVTRSKTLQWWWRCCCDDDAAAAADQRDEIWPKGIEIFPGLTNVQTWLATATSRPSSSRGPDEHCFCRADCSVGQAVGSAENSLRKLTPGLLRGGEGG